VVTAIAESDDRCRETASSLAPAARLFSDYHELIANADVDAVVICLPTGLHAPAAEAAMERGMHVYVEKPLATCMTDARRLAHSALRAGCTTMVGFNFRFHPLVIELRQAVQTGQLGELVSIHTEFCSAGRELPNWKRNRDSGGGALLDLASHQFDLLSFVTGSGIRDVSCLISSRRSQDDTAVGTLRLSNGVPVSMVAALSAVDVHRIEVTGVKGSLTFDRYRSSRLSFRPGRRDFATAARLRASAEWLIRAPLSLGDVLRPPRESSFGSALGEFVEAAIRNEPAEPGFQAGLNSLAVVRAAEQSASHGRRTDVAEWSEPA
jgi:predicted dehydrogenase